MISFTELYEAIEGKQSESERVLVYTVGDGRSGFTRLNNKTIIQKWNVTDNVDAEYLRDVNFSLKIRNSDLEGDPSNIQLVTFNIIRLYSPFADSKSAIDSNSLVLCYQRPVSQTESRLTGKRSFGIGGHINASDLVRTNSLVFTDGLIARYRLESLIRAAAYRELAEELPSIANFSDLPLNTPKLELSRTGYIIHDGTDLVGKSHIGYVLVWTIKRPLGVTVSDIEERIEKGILKDGSKVEGYCSKSIAPGSLGFSRMIDICNDDHLENWCKKLAKYICSYDRTINKIARACGLTNSRSRYFNKVI
jgi:predicted NUDIX family phosphoesterase